MSKFATGIDTLAKKSKGVQFARTQFFGLDDGEEVVVRLLTDYDQVIPVQQHQGSATRPRPDWLPAEANWSPKWGCVCRNTLMADGTTRLWEVMDDSDDMPGCYVCDNVRIVGGKQDGKLDRPKPRGWALACIRREVIGDGSEALGGPSMQGQIVSYVDATREVEKDGKSVVEKDIQVINLGHRNFFTLFDAPFGRFKTLLDRDFAIKRVGEGLDTTYQIVHLDPIPGHDLRDPAVRATYGMEASELEEIVMGRAEAAYIRRFFDPNYTPPKHDEAKSSEGGAPAQEQAKSSGDVDQAQLAAMAAKIQGHRPAGETSTDGEAPSGQMVNVQQ